MSTQLSAVVCGFCYHFLQTDIAVSTPFSVEFCGVNAAVMKMGDK